MHTKFQGFKAKCRNHFFLYKFIFILGYGKVVKNLYNIHIFKCKVKAWLYLRGNMVGTSHTTLFPNWESKLWRDNSVCVYSSPMYDDFWDTLHSKNLKMLKKAFKLYVDSVILYQCWFNQMQCADVLEYSAFPSNIL